MKKYKLLKDLPTVDKGAIFEQDGDNSNYYSCIGKDNETFRFTGKDVMELKDWFEEVKENKRWRAKEGIYYYYIDHYVDIEEQYEEECKDDESRYEVGNYYQTKELAQKALDKQLMFQKLKDYALEVNEGWVFNNKAGYFIELNKRTNSIEWKWVSDFIRMNQVYFKTVKLAEEAIARFGDDLKILFEN